LQRHADVAPRLLSRIRAATGRDPAMLFHLMSRCADTI
jgi:hypothetical protein